MVYTPGGADNVEDTFVFQVTDTSGNTGMATVHVNPPGDPTPTQRRSTRWRGADANAEVARGYDVEVPLTADAPDGVSLDLLAGRRQRPAEGSLSGLTQGSESPQRSAAVTYPANGDFVGNDSFDFQACGTIDSVLVCDTATATVHVESGDAVADPQEVETPQDTSIDITLTGTAGAGAKGGGA